MKKPVLIVRTVSVEKLSTVLNTCQREWVGHPLWVVSNQVRVGEIAMDVRVSRAIPYEGGAEGFAEPVVLGELLQAVIVPVANEHGSGYGNVLNACSRLLTNEFVLCSRCQTIKHLSRFEFFLKGRMERWLFMPARFFATFWSERLLERE